MMTSTCQASSSENLRWSPSFLAGCITRAPTAHGCHAKSVGIPNHPPPGIIPATPGTLLTSFVLHGYTKLTTGNLGRAPDCTAVALYSVFALHTVSFVSTPSLLQRWFVIPPRSSRLPDGPHSTQQRKPGEQVSASARAIHTSLGKLWPQAYGKIQLQERRSLGVLRTRRLLSAKFSVDRNHPSLTSAIACPNIHSTDPIRCSYQSGIRAVTSLESGSDPCPHLARAAVIDVIVVLALTIAVHAVSRTFRIVLADVTCRLTSCDVSSRAAELLIRRLGR
jgi:hypothetical protein